MLDKLEKVKEGKLDPKELGVSVNASKFQSKFNSTAKLPAN